MNFRLNSKLKSHPKQNLQKSLEREYEVFCKMVVVHSLFIPYDITGYGVSRPGIQN